MILRKVSNILELIGKTPLVRVNNVSCHSSVQIWAKLEYMNPGGSVKDRPALNMIYEAEKSGRLTSNKIVLEATSGNTGIGLAMVCAVKGYKMLFTMSESVSQERRKILKAYGANILDTPAHLGTDGAIEEAYRLAREEPNKYFLVDQFNNMDNWSSHYYQGIADEIYEDTEGAVTHVIATMGTTGTLMGIARRFRELNSSIKVIGIEPYQGHKIQGLKNMKESYPPGIFNPHEVDCIVNVNDDSAYKVARWLAQKEGIFVGMSAGAAVKVAVDIVAKLKSGLVVAILPDGGERYLSTKLYSSEKVYIFLNFYNTITRRIEELRPIHNNGKIGIYVCGPSLDGQSDLGLCRRMVFADLVRRYLEFRGFKVNLIINIADIDDRTVSQCLKEGAKLNDFTNKWEKIFFEDMTLLKVLPANHYPKASEHVTLMIDQVRKLLKKGLAYEKLRSVYFNISRFSEYGKLSRVNLKSVQFGKTVDYDYYDKDNPRDFTLLKRASLAELKAGIYWETPYGNVRPGWHIECATMATRHLGQPFDLHLASTDLIFPHGDNEIAVAEGVVGLPLAKMWLHSEVVMAEGRKISRTHGNDLTLHNILSQGYSPIILRYWLLSQHYRRVLTCSDQQLKLASYSVYRLIEFMQRLLFMKISQYTTISIFMLDQFIYETKNCFQRAMDYDLNLPRAIGYLFVFIKRVNRFLTKRLISEIQINNILELMNKINRVLGVSDFNQQRNTFEIQRLVKERDAARRIGNFEVADRLRDDLIAQGVQFIDLPIK